MQLAHRVSLGGVQLDELDERINIKAVEEAAGKDNISAVSAAAGCGQRITGRRRDTLDVTVKFSMLIGTDDLAARSELLEKVNTWAAGGGWLRVNYKENRRLFVVCAQAPGAGDPFEWTTVYTVTFRAYACPYWEEDAETTATGNSGNSGSVSLQVGGSVDTCVRISLANTSGATVDTVEVNADGKKMKFTSLGLGGNETLTIEQVIIGGQLLTQMKIGSRSVMAKRTETSADSLTVSPGVRTISWTSSRACRLTAGVRGRFV